MSIHESLKDRWDNEKIPANYNHTDVEPQREPYYEKYVIKLSALDFKDKTVVDYGIGGGWLGKLLLEKYGIKKYIGFDISERSLTFARQNLKDYKNKKLILVKDWPDFNMLGADVFITLACIQHFPNMAYLLKWLEKVNSSGIKDLILQYRLGPKVSFVDKGVLTFASTLPMNSIDKHLPNYTRWGGYNIPGKVNYRFAFFKIKEGVKSETAREGNITAKEDI